MKRCILTMVLTALLGMGTLVPQADAAQAENRPKQPPQVIQRAPLNSLGIEGRVAVDMYVDAEGKVPSVRIWRSSGYPLLDAYMLVYFHAGSVIFSPALDAEGQPVPCYVRQMFSFSKGEEMQIKLAEAVKQVQPKIKKYPDVKTQTVISAKLDDKGKVQETKTLVSSGNEEYDTAAAELVQKKWKFSPAYDAEGKAAASSTACVIYFGYLPNPPEIQSGKKEG
ncbi:MAG: TonB family protein [Selenomonas artemidis]|nr:TonB family protein [Selenomonas artemidis]